ncbi:MAG: type II toxin-antitoxin system HicB family antitoxin [Acidobacteriota bacterium]
MRYPVILKADGTFILARFPDVSAHTQGTSREDALHHALDALETALMYILGTPNLIPLPSPVKRGQSYVDLPPSIAAKILLHNEMVKQKVRPAELARRMSIPHGKLMRVLSLKYKTKFETTELALNALGKHFEFSVV